MDLLIFGWFPSKFEPDRGFCIDATVSWTLDPDFRFESDFCYAHKNELVQNKACVLPDYQVHTSAVEPFTALDRAHTSGMKLHVTCSHDRNRDDKKVVC